MNLLWPFHSKDLINNSPYSLPYNSYVSLENLVLDHLIFPWLTTFSFFMPVVCLILYWHGKEKFCHGHSKGLRDNEQQKFFH